jgi:predicted pPIWI-associating nuclease
MLSSVPMSNIPKKISPEDLHDDFLDYMINQEFPEDLLSLASHVYIEGLSDLEIDNVTENSDEREVEGSGTVDVKLEYGGGESRDGIESRTSLPFDFKLLLDSANKIHSARINVNTSSFEKDEEE